MTDALSIRGLVKRFGGKTAVDGLSFDVGTGEVLGFLGPNGAGKSTTMKMICGFLAPTAGTVFVCGHDVTIDPIAAKSRIGYLPEGAPAARRERVVAAMAATKLEEVAHQPIETLSKGFKRRVGLAQALLHDPDILILDEPTDGLDPNQKFEVRRLITEMAHRKTIVISTHILEEVEAVCTRAMIIARGRILADGTPAELKRRSATGNMDEVFREITLGAAQPLEASGA